MPLLAIEKPSTFIFIKKMEIMQLICQLSCFQNVLCLNHFCTIQFEYQKGTKISEEEKVVSKGFTGRISP